jgi:hypothetical protein
MKRASPIGFIIVVGLAALGFLSCSSKTKPGDGSVHNEIDASIGTSAAGSGGTSQSTRTDAMVLAGSGGTIGSNDASQSLPNDATVTAGSGGTSANDASLRHQAPYPAAKASDCGGWALVDNVCCAQYCSDNNTSEGCGSCGGQGSAQCVAVNSKGCISGEWPEVHSVDSDEDGNRSLSNEKKVFGLCSWSILM